MSGALQRLPMSAWSHTLLSRWLYHHYPGKSARLTRQHTGHRSAMTFRALQPCRFPHYLSWKYPVKTLSLVTTSPHCRSHSLPLQHHQDPPHPLPRGLRQEMWSGITPNHQSHCQQALGFPWDPVPDSLSEPDPDYLSCRNSMHSLSHFLTQSWSLKRRNLISSLKSEDLEMGSAGENVMGCMVVVSQQRTDL